jgi:hypothetical protein
MRSLAARPKGWGARQLEAAGDTITETILGAYRTSATAG